MHWEQSLRIVSSKRNPPLNYNLSMTGNYKCSNTYIELTLIKQIFVMSRYQNRHTQRPDMRGKESKCTFL